MHGTKVLNFAVHKEPRRIVINSNTFSSKSVHPNIKHLYLGYKPKHRNLWDLTAHEKKSHIKPKCKAYGFMRLCGGFINDHNNQI